jgi:hypothetical protein
MAETEKPREIFDNSARHLVWALRGAGASTKAAVVLVQDGDGKIGMVSHGVNHAEAVNLLSTGIHLALTDHDKHVLAGAAGADAQCGAVECQQDKEG